MIIKNFLWTALAALLTLCEINAQEVSLNVIKEKFNNFDYGNVIILADSLLSMNESLSKDETTELLRMKAVSHYSLSDTTGAAQSFREILKLSPGFLLDSLDNSPKIISFFNNIKSRFRPEIKSGGDETSNKHPEIKQPSAAAIYLSEYNDRLKNSLLRSLILPGWGHFYSGNSAKGWILSSAGLASLSSLVYFIADSRSKEKAYLNERNPFLISDKYDKYNFSNKMKYVSLAAYALVWSYSQVDLLFFSDGLFKTEIDLQPQQFTFSLKIPLP